MKTLNKFLIVAIAGSSFLLPSCKKDNKPSPDPPIYGPVANLASGSIRSFVIMDAQKKPITIGMRFTANALSGLPTDSTVEHEYPLELPDEAKLTGFDHLVVDWNPVGHEPKAIYGLPHFDFHFYRISKQEQAAVVPGPDTVSVSPNFVPKDYISGVIAVPDMGVHWVDSKAPEFNGQKFTDTFIYGFYHGQLTFMEPMITLDYLLSKPDLQINIKQPQAFQKAGYYPTVSHIYFDPSKNEYVMALEGLVWRDAGSGN